MAGCAAGGGGVLAADAAAVRAEVDAQARALKAAGDERPGGLLRAAVLHGLVTRSWEERSGRE